MEEPKVPKSAYQGHVILDNDTLLVRFNYSKYRFSEIKALREARYDKNSRAWRLPLEALSKLERLKSFKPEHIKYDLDRELITSRTSQILEKRAELLEQIRANPYAVSLESIKLSQIQIYFLSAVNQPGIIVKLARFSKLKHKLMAIPGVHYLKTEDGYFFPVQFLNSFILDLKSSQIDFAVEENLGMKLKKSAKDRQLVMQGQHGQYEVMLNAELAPILMLNVGDSTVGKFQLVRWTTEQLRKLLPSPKTFNERKELARKLDYTALASLFENSVQHEINIWITDTAYKQIRQAFAGEVSKYHASQLFCSEFDLAWYVGRSNQVCLAIKSAQLEKLNLEIKLDYKENQFCPVAGYNSISFDYFNAKEAYLKIKDWTQKLELDILESDNFLKILEEYELRQKRLARQKYFQSITDYDLTNDLPEHQARLFPHQRVAVAWLLENKKALLGDDMGLGKTLSVLSTFYSLQNKKETDFICIVCPNSLVTNWQREASTWFETLHIANLPETANKQSKFFSNFIPGLHAQGIVINFESFRIKRIYQAILELTKQSKIMLIVDESQRVKNPKSQIFNALASISSQVERTVLLSGTPTPRDISDIWSQLYLLDQGERLGSNYYEWLKSVAELGNKWSEFAVKKFIPDKVKEVKLRVHELLLRRTKEEVVNLPEKLFSIRDVKLSAGQLARYEEVRKELLLRVNALDGTEYVKQISSVLEEFLRAVQIAVNPRLVDPSWVGEPAKFLELDEIVSEVTEQSGKIVIWTNFVENIKELTLRYSKYGAKAFYGEVSKQERQVIIDSFQDPQSTTKVLVAIPSAGGVGITLTAARTAVYLDKTWNAEHWLQSVDRLHRIGQTGTVNIISLHACLIDQLISKNVRKKELQQSELMNRESVDNSMDLPQLNELKLALSSS